MIKTVFIDIDDTLLDFDLSAEEAMFAAARDMGIPLPENMLSIFVPINIGLWKDMEKGLITPERLFEIRWNTIFSHIGVTADGVAFEKIFTDYLSISAIPMEGAMEMMEYLSGKYTVCVASNAPYRQQILRMEKVGMDRYISHYFISERLGASKPTKEFFDACFAQLDGIRPDEAVIIGDSLTADINGGRQYGMKTLWFCRKGDIRAEHGADFAVEKLADVKKLL